MKKLNKIVLSSMILLAGFTLGAGLLGCKTVPAGNVVDPINLLDNKSGFYIAIPKEADADLVKRIITKNIPSLPEKNVKMICDRTTKIYSGINRSRKGTEVQSAIEGTIPTGLIPKLLTSKNGWEINRVTTESSVIPHIVYNANGLDVSFPGPNVVCIGRDMEYMLNKHDKLSIVPTGISEGLLTAPEATDTSLSNNYVSDLSKNVYDYLKGADSEIRFYANKPQSFLTILTGTNLDLKLIDVKGSFLVDPNHSNQYILNIYFNFRENKYLKAGKALLNLAFGLSNSQSDLIGDNGLEITGIKISKETLYKILVL